MCAAGPDGDIHSPISVEAFSAHCRNMHENSDRPFSEEFQVAETQVQTIAFPLFNLLNLAPF